MKGRASRGNLIMTKSSAPIPFSRSQPYTRADSSSTCCLVKLRSETSSAIKGLAGEQATTFAHCSQIYGILSKKLIFMGLAPSFQKETGVVPCLLSTVCCLLFAVCCLLSTKPSSSVYTTKYNFSVFFLGRPNRALRHTSKGSITATNVDVPPVAIQQRACPLQGQAHAFKS